MNEKYSFSNDVIFNEDLSGHLGVSRSPPSSPLNASSSASPLASRLSHAIPRVCTAAGQAYDEIIRLKESRWLDCERRRFPDRVVAVYGVLWVMPAQMGVLWVIPAWMGVL